MRREGEREGQKQQRVRDTSTSCVLHAPSRGPGPHPGMCPNWKSNPQPFYSQTSAQSIEPHQLGQFQFHKKVMMMAVQNYEIFNTDEVYT